MLPSSSYHILRHLSQQTHVGGILTSLVWSFQPTVVFLAISFVFILRKSNMEKTTLPHRWFHQYALYYKRVVWLNPHCCVQKCPRISLDALDWIYKNGHESWRWEKSPICQKKKRENWWWISKTTPHDCCLVALISADFPCISKWLEWFISHPSGPSISGFLQMGGSTNHFEATLTLETSMFYQARAPRYVCCFKQPKNIQHHLTIVIYKPLVNQVIS